MILLTGALFIEAPDLLFIHMPLRCLIDHQSDGIVGDHFALFQFLQFGTLHQITGYPDQIAQLFILPLFQNYHIRYSLKPFVSPI